MNTRSMPVSAFSAGRPRGIKNIVIHHFAGVMTAQAVANLHNRNRSASYHYGIGSDGIVARYVAESNRAWHAGDGIGNGSRGNDLGIGIGVSNSSGGPNWPISEHNFDLLVELVRDVARRNNLLPLRPGKNLLGHRALRATACPGNFLNGRLQELANRVNAPAVGSTPPPASAASNPFDIVTIAATRFRVTATSLNIRANPDTSSRIIGSVRQDTVVSSTRRANRGQAVNGNRKWIAHASGWISAAHLATPVQQWRTSGGVHVRTGAGTNNRSLRVVPANTVVTAISNTTRQANGHTWRHVSVGGKRGWMAVSLMRPV